MNLIKKLIKQTQGFTLIEALVSIAVVAMIVTPLSMVFTGTLEHTIETKQVLNATQLAQLCMENLKAKTEGEFKGFFTDLLNPNKMIVENNFDGITIPDGYVVEVDYLEPELDYQVISEFDTHDYDFEIILDDSDTLNFDILPKGGSLSHEISNSTSRIIKVTYDYDYIYIRNSDGANYITELENLDGIQLFKINCNGTNTAQPFGDTVIEIINKTSDPVDFYVYEVPDSTVNLTISKGTEGTIVEHMNMITLNVDKYEFYDIRVRIYRGSEVEVENHTIEPITDITSTKSDK